MNIEIANRLVNLRKSNNLSQEALAAKLGISRQAVSKWERAEASPDTDNLILLARLYKVSLDELLRTEDEVVPKEDGEKEDAQEVPAEMGKEEYVHVGFEGVHVRDKQGEVHVGWDGIHVDDRKNNESVHIGKEGVWVNGERKDKDWFRYLMHFPMGGIILAVYLVIGVAFNAWHPGWLLFLLIPIWYSLVVTIKKRNASCFAYPIFAVLVYLCLGIFHYAWHPGWVIFLTVPFYYPLTPYINSWLESIWENNEEGYGKWEGKDGWQDEE